jgi:hypothetical protein
MNANTKLDICNTCENYKVKIKMCTQCHCYMPIKVNLPFVRCPIGKW